MDKKPIQYSEAPPRPWHLCESKGGKMYIYADGESQPLEVIKMSKRPTRRALATLKLISAAVNSFEL
jgi:hypothetical protein